MKHLILVPLFILSGCAGLMPQPLPVQAPVQQVVKAPECRPIKAALYADGLEVRAPYINAELCSGEVRMRVPRAVAHGVLARELKE